MNTDIKDIKDTKGTKDKAFEDNNSRNGFTSSQKELIAFLEKYKAEHGKMPTLRAAAALLGCSHQNISGRFTGLYWKGYPGVTFRDTGKSKIRLLLDSDPSKNYTLEEIARLTGFHTDNVYRWFCRNRHCRSRLISNKVIKFEANRAKYTAAYEALAAKLTKLNRRPPTLIELADAAGMTYGRLGNRLRYYGIKLDLSKGYR